MDRADNNRRPPPDSVLVEIADYVCDYEITSEAALETARYCLMDSLGCAILALNETACRRHLGPVVPGAMLSKGARVPGTCYELDPVQAAYNIGCMIRWLDYNDTWLAAEWGHPSDNLGAILACADYTGRQQEAAGQTPLSMRAILNALIKAYEIQGVLALRNSFNRIGLDHVILVRIASTALATALLGRGRDAIIDALANAWMDGATLRTYRHAPNTGWRKSWAAGDATARGVRLALLADKGDTAYPSALSAPRWGFYDSLYDGRCFESTRPYGTEVVENILFKVSFPAEFHAQTAVECALHLHPRVKDRLDQIEQIVLTTQAAALHIINKTGPLHNPADRDHCLQYTVAIGLLYGELCGRHYSDEVAADPRIDRLRSKMLVIEDSRYSRDYLNPGKRSIANEVAIHFADGEVEQLQIEYPLGHPRRRREAWPLLEEKFTRNLGSHYDAPQVRALRDLLRDPERLLAMPVTEFMALWTH